MSNDMVRKGYNRAANRYTSNRDQFKNDRYLEKLASILPAGSTILDIGCGGGIPVDKYFVDRGYKVIGVDVSEEQIKLAKKNVPTAEFKVADMSALREGEYQVDAVLSFYAIFHLPREQHAEIFHKMNSFLSSGDLILVTMGSSDWEGTEDDFHGVKMFWSHYDSRKNRAIIESAGFEVILDEIDETGGEKHQVVLAKK